MKTLLIGLVALTSLSAFAANECEPKMKKAIEAVAMINYGVKPVLTASNYEAQGDRNYANASTVFDIEGGKKEANIIVAAHSDNMKCEIVRIDSESRNKSR